MPELGYAFLLGRLEHRISLGLTASFIRYCGTPEEAARPVEEVLDYVPGECWPQLLTSPGATILVEELLRAEVLGLPRPLYSQVCIFRIFLPFQSSNTELWSRAWFLLSPD